MITFVYKKKDPEQEEMKKLNLQLLSQIRQQQLANAQGKEEDNTPLSLPGTTVEDNPLNLPDAVSPLYTKQIPGKQFPITKKDFSAKAADYLPWMTKEDRTALGFAGQKEANPVADEPFTFDLPNGMKGVTTKSKLVAAVNGAQQNGLIDLIPPQSTGGQTAQGGPPPPSSARTAPALPFPFMMGGKTEKPRQHVLNGQIVEEQEGGGYKPVFGEPQQKAPQTRQVTQGDSIVEQEWDGTKWVNIGGGPRYKPMAQGPSPTDIRHTSTSLRKEFNSLQPVKDYRDVENKFNVMRKAAEESATTSNYVAVDQALVTLYNKMTDPSSVVRESEYIRTPQDMAIKDRVEAGLKRIGKGGRLEPDTRQALMTMAAKFQDVYTSKFLDLADEYRGYATGYGIDPNLVVDIKRYQPKKPPETPTGTSKFTIKKVGQ